MAPLVQTFVEGGGGTYCGENSLALPGIEYRTHVSASESGAEASLAGEEASSRAATSPPHPIANGATESAKTATTVRVLKVHECDARDVARPPSQLGVKHPAGMLPWQTSVVPEHGWALLQEKLPESVPGAGATPGTMVRFSDV